MSGVGVRDTKFKREKVSPTTCTLYPCWGHFHPAPGTPDTLPLTPGTCYPATVPLLSRDLHFCDLSDVHGLAVDGSFDCHHDTHRRVSPFQ